MSRRILLVTSVLPWPLRRNGGAQRSALLKKALEKWGEVDVYAIGGSALRENTPEFDEQLKEQNVVECIVRQSLKVSAPWYLPGPLGSAYAVEQKYAANYASEPATAARTQTLIRERRYDLVIGRYLQPVMQSGAIKVDVPKILDFDDIDHLTLQAQIAAKPWTGLGGKLGAKRSIARVTDICTTALKQFQTVFVTSEEDRAALSVPTKVLPNIPFADDLQQWLQPLPPATESRELLFVGDLQFPPNREGLDHFIAKVWPLIRANVEDAMLTIVGRGLSEEMRAKWSAIAGLNVVGFAPDLEECYRRCAMTVVPIYFGGGTKIKVLESLAFGRTVVTTPQAMRGYADLAATPPSVAVAGTDEEFAGAAVRLLREPALRDSMAQRGRAIVEQSFSPARFQAVVDGALTEVLG